MKRKIRDRFIHLCLNKTSLIYAIYVTIVVSFGIFIYWREWKTTETRIVEQMLHREQVIVRAGAKSIESFFEIVSNTLSLMATRQSIKTTSDDTNETLNNFVTRWEDTPIVGVVLVGSSGIITHNANINQQPDIGMDVSGREYFVWAKSAKEGEIFIGKSIISRLGASKGKYIVPIATPIFNDGNFKGVLVAPVVLSKLTKDYLDPLRISENSLAHLLDEDGVVISSYVEKITGENIFEYLKDNPFPGSDLLVSVIEEKFDKAISDGEEGKLDYYRNDITDKLHLKRMLMAYEVVNLDQSKEILNSRKWVLAVETPAEDAFAFTGPFYGMQYLMFLYFIVVVIGFALLAILTNHLVKNKAYIDGRLDGKEKSIRK